MRLLADENFPKPAVEALRAGGCDVLWARTDMPRASDADLLEVAETQGRIVLTLDKDFWQIALQRRRPLVEAGVVLFRVHPCTASRLSPLVREFLKAGRKWSGHVSVLGPGSLQMLPSA